MVFFVVWFFRGFVIKNHFLFRFIRVGCWVLISGFRRQQPPSFPASYLPSILYSTKHNEPKKPNERSKPDPGRTL